ncbi:restriction endonuclease subunit S [Acidovorax sp.]|uniref:restriction endonuclease subunit S n=1 Tax=Acidovorax sp. TaxID=1872122 RepID=UPI0025B834DC|nr:restriction endonuclease subunit S [Acidovorax sp.]MBW8464592.1 restriction endonuclease subunit S [Acidovorax sp.]
MEWVDIRLGDACTKIGSGATPKGGGSVYLDAGPIAFIRSQNIYNEGFSNDGMVYLDEKLAQGLANVQVEDLDVLLNITGDSVARACQVAQEVLPARVNQHVAIIRTNQQILWPTYLRYFLVSPAMQAHMLGLAAVGATRNALTKGMIESFSIRCPKEVDDQKAIADVLSSLDIKIDLNRRINQTLEAMAQAIFQSWFVDFDPVKAKIAAKAEGRDPQRAAIGAISGKTDAELDALPPEQYEQLAATAALFPDELEASELGEIPKGWSASPFGSLLAHTIGGDWGSDVPDSSNDTRVAIIRGTDIPDLDQAQAHRVPIRYTTQKKLASRMLQVGDIVLEVSGGSKDQPTGRSLRITANTMHGFDCPIEPASFCRLLRPISQEVSVILGLHLARIYAQGKTWEYQNQSTGIANFQTTHFLDAELVAKPPAMVAEKFYGLVNPLLERRHDAQSRRLAVLRDTLLPKLLSGELLVADAMVEAVA